MSRTTFGTERGAISKAEKVAWLQFGLLLVASACMAWLWWLSWPDTTLLQRNAAMFERWPSWLMIAALGCIWFIKLRQPREPLEDERDRMINGEARTHAFAALALMVVLLCVAVQSDGLLQDHLTPDWLTLTLMSMLGLALLFDTAYRLVRYRWG
ncbi:MAG: hypothetical protein ACREPE_08105 [Lysobacter sp.]